MTSETVIQSTARNVRSNAAWSGSSESIYKWRGLFQQTPGNHWCLNWNTSIQVFTLVFLFKFPALFSALDCLKARTNFATTIKTRLSMSDRKRVGHVKCRSGQSDQDLEDSQKFCRFPENSVILSVLPPRQDYCRGLIWFERWDLESCPPLCLGCLCNWCWTRRAKDIKSPTGVNVILIVVNRGYIYLSFQHWEWFKSVWDLLFEQIP